MKSNVLFIVFSFILSSANAQSYQWTRNWSALNSLIGRNIAADAQSNTYSICMFSKTADFDPGPGIFNLTTQDSNNVAISKLDGSGNFVWAGAFTSKRGVYAYSVALDPDNNVYATGTFSDTTDFDPGTGTYTLPGSTSGSMFLSKLDSAGHFLWAKSIGGPVSPRLVQTDKEGNVYFLGNYYDTVDMDPGTTVFELFGTGGFLLKLDRDGNFVWAKKIGNEKSFLSTFTVDGLGNIYFGGELNGSADIDPDTGSSILSGKRCFLGKLNNDGTLIWVNSIDQSRLATSTRIMYLYSMSTDAQNNLYSAGQFLGSIDFDPGADSFKLEAKSANACILKLDSNGIFVWARSIKGSEYTTAMCLSADSSGNAYVAGTFSGTADFDPDSGTHIMSSMGYRDIFAVKLDPEGRFSWSRSMGGARDDFSGGIVVDKRNNVFLSGCFFETMCLYPYEFHDCITPTGPVNIFVHKMSPVPAKIQETVGGDDFSIFPNPGHDEFNIERGSAAAESFAVQVYTVLGQLLDNKPSRNGQVKLRLGQYPPGIYALKILSAGQVCFRQLILQ